MATRATRQDLAPAWQQQASFVVQPRPRITSIAALPGSRVRSDVDRAGLKTPLKVMASFSSDCQKLRPAIGASILIQRMVAAEYAGVLFTQDPAAGAPMVELVQGTAENLVTGSASSHLSLGRVSGQPSTT
jgi:hypothetical protein